MKSISSLIGKYLSKLLSPLTVNDYTLKDSFGTANRIKAIAAEIMNRHQFVSFDVVSLFTNVPHHT